jgi:hypothetical protein
MPKWKQNGWRNSKKANVTNRTLWLSLDTEIARHRRVQFSWVNGHRGILLNEIADTLVTRGVMGSSYCPTDRFDAPSADSEKEDGPEPRGVAPVVTQDAEWDEDIHFPTFSTPATSYDFAAEEARDRVDSVFNRFS